MFITTLLNQFNISLDFFSSIPTQTRVTVVWPPGGGGGGHSTFFQVGVCGPDFCSVGLAN